MKYQPHLAQFPEWPVHLYKNKFEEDGHTNEDEPSVGQVRPELLRHEKRVKDSANYKARYDQNGDN